MCLKFFVDNFLSTSVQEKRISSCDDVTHKNFLNNLLIKLFVKRSLFMLF